MRLGGRRPGNFTVFRDAVSEEVLLEIGVDEDGAPLVSFHLYDGRGSLVSDSEGLRNFPDGAEVRDQGDELLLLLPVEPTGNVQYRLYSSKGTLLTCSDGLRTQIFGNLRLEGSKHLPGY